MNLSCNHKSSIMQLFSYQSGYNQTYHNMKLKHSCSIQKQIQGCHTPRITHMMSSKRNGNLIRICFVHLPTQIKNAAITTNMLDITSPTFEPRFKLNACSTNQISPLSGFPSFPYHPVQWEPHDHLGQFDYNLEPHSMAVIVWAVKLMPSFESRFQAVIIDKSADKLWMELIYGQTQMHALIIESFHELRTASIL